MLKFFLGGGVTFIQGTMSIPDSRVSRNPGLASNPTNCNDPGS